MLKLIGFLLFHIYRRIRAGFISEKVRYEREKDRQRRKELEKIWGQYKC